MANGKMRAVFIRIPETYLRRLQRLHPGITVKSQLVAHAVCEYLKLQPADRVEKRLGRRVDTKA